MNVAIIKHLNGQNKEYLFKVPINKKIAKGTLVKVKTRYGEDYGVLTHDSFEADGEALAYIRQSFGAPKNGELQCVTAVYSETPAGKVFAMKGECFDEAKYVFQSNIRAADRGEKYVASYKHYPIKFRAQRKDNGETMESPCVYTTSDGKMYLGTVNTATQVDVYAGEIYTMQATLGGNPLFVEIKPETLEWTVEK